MPIYVSKTRLDGTLYGYKCRFFDSTLGLRFAVKIFIVQRSHVIEIDDEIIFNELSINVMLAHFWRGSSCGDTMTLLFAWLGKIGRYSEEMETLNASISSVSEHRAVIILVESFRTNLGWYFFKEILLKIFICCKHPIFCNEYLLVFFFWRLNLLNEISWIIKIIVSLFDSVILVIVVVLVNNF